MWQNRDSGPDPDLSSCELLPPRQGNVKDLSFLISETSILYFNPY